MRVWIAIAAVSFGVAMPAVAGMLPDGDDLGITLRVESMTDPQFLVGTRATLAFDVTSRGPQHSATYSIVGHEEPYAGNRRIKLFQSPGAGCTLVDLIGSTSPPGLAYFLVGPSPPIGSTVTCRVELRVDAVPVGNVYAFAVSGSVVYGNGAIGPIADPDPTNNRILLPIGDGAQPVPALSIWAALALLVTLAASAFSFLDRRIDTRQPASKRSG
ncbi:MAG: hypothetical protein ABIR62_14165 [Dokdonella sp.]|uniref:hypothetical protein n=1 Tax=Dokdonella sp. TaxID=2291710 RepID=UPI003264C786